MGITDSACFKTARDALSHNQRAAPRSCPCAGGPGSADASGGLRALTFASMAARVPFVPLSFNERFGQMMNLEHAPEYLELGQSVIALLSEQETSRALPTIDRLLSPRDPGASVELNRNPPATYGSVGLERNRSA